MIESIKNQERLPDSKKVRLWKMGKLTIEEVYDHIKKMTRPINSFEYKIKFLGKKIDDEKAKLSDMEFEDDEFFVAETIDGMKKWHLYADNEGKCEGCYSIA